jgi:hypothetical protein
LLLPRRKILRQKLKKGKIFFGFNWKILKNAAKLRNSLYLTPEKYFSAMKKRHKSSGS